MEAREGRHSNQQCKIVAKEPRIECGREERIDLGECEGRNSYIDAIHGSMRFANRLRRRDWRAPCAPADDACNATNVKSKQKRVQLEPRTVARRRKKCMDSIPTVNQQAVNGDAEMRQENAYREIVMCPSFLALVHRRSGCQNEMVLASRGC